LTQNGTYTQVAIDGVTLLAAESGTNTVTVTNGDATETTYNFMVSVDVPETITVDGIVGATGAAGSDGAAGGITSMGGVMTNHIIPDTNSVYDIGSAEYKVRHLFLSDNSLWIGDDHKVSIEGGKQKQKKRKKGKTPKKIFDALIGAGKLFPTEADLKIKFKTDIHDPEPVPTADPDHADFQPKVHQWLHFAIINGMAGTVNPENIFDGTDDFEDEAPETGITSNPGFPLVTTNGAVGDLWLNTTTGELYACTDATVDANIWTNTGDGTGNIMPNDPPGNPTNTTIGDQGTGSSFTYTFTGGTDTDGTVTHYMVDEITGTSGGNAVPNAMTVALPEVPVGVPHQFTVGTLPDISDISFRVRSKDNNGSYSSGVTVNFSGTVVAYYGNRGIFAGGMKGWNDPTANIDFVNIPTGNNATVFGNLSEPKSDLASCSDRTKGLFAGGDRTADSYLRNTIEYVTISTQSNVVDWGDLTTSRYRLSSCSDGIRGLFAAGMNPSWAYLNSVDFKSVASSGNCVNYWDLTVAKVDHASCSNGTRGLFGGGVANGNFISTIEFLTISTSGASVVFGNLLKASTRLASCSDKTRGLFGAGDGNGATVGQELEFVTISTNSNGSHFGNLEQNTYDHSACSDGTKGLFGGGYGGASPVNRIQQVNISTQSDATDFGDLTLGTLKNTSCSGD
jgi:hypothetical protein